MSRSDRPTMLSQTSTRRKFSSSSKDKVAMAVCKAYREAGVPFPTLDHANQLSQVLGADVEIVNVPSVTVDHILKQSAGIKKVLSTFGSMDQRTTRVIFFKEMGSAGSWSVAVSNITDKITNYVCLEGVYIVSLKDLPYCIYT